MNERFKYVCFRLSPAIKNNLLKSATLILLPIQLKSELYFNLMAPFYGSVQLSQCYRSTTRREFTFRKFELQRNLTG